MGRRGKVTMRVNVGPFSFGGLGRYLFWIGVGIVLYFVLIHVF